MQIKVCVAGATGWTGGAVTQQILRSSEFKLVGAIARKKAGQDIGEAHGLPHAGVLIANTLEEALPQSCDVLIDYTKPDSVKARVLAALNRGVRVIVGTSGLTASDYAEIDQEAQRLNLGVIASGNFSVTAALATHFALIAAKYLPSCEIIDYAHARKGDAPSGTSRELAERMAGVRAQSLEVPLSQTHGAPEARGASVGGAQVHSVRLPGFISSFEALFGLPHERLTIRHDSGSGAEPYVAGTLLAARRVMQTRGLRRGLDQLLFGE